MVTEEAFSVAGVRVERDATAEMRDGTVLRADIYRPRDEGDYPTLLMRVPYHKSVAQSVTYHHPSWYTRQGYVVIVQDCRGRHRSEGRFEPLRNEAHDGYDSVEWAARVPESDGRVGMYGFSYAGATQLLAAAEQPPALICCAPGFTASDYYDGWTYDKGALNLGFIVSWVVQMLAIPEALSMGETRVAEAIRRRILDFPELYRERPLSEFSLLHDTRVASYFFEWLRHDSRDHYWEEIGLDSRYDAITVPCLHIGGWYDIFSAGTVRNFSALSRRASGDPGREQRLLMGPWMHMPWASKVGTKEFGPSASNLVDEVQLRWFDYWLKDDGGEGLEGAPVTLFVGGEDRWHGVSSWPPEGTEVQEWFLHSDGKANSRSGDGILSRDASEPQQWPDVFVYDPGNPTPSAGGRSCCNALVAPMGPAPQDPVEVRNDVLIYTSDALPDDVTATGQVWLTLHASTSAVDTDWVARLVDVGREGQTLNVCQGIIRARFRESLAEPAELEPGRIYEYHVDLGPISWTFQAGHRFRIHVTSADFPTHDANSNTGLPLRDVGPFDGVIATQFIFHDERRPSRLSLPVMTGGIFGS